jgi:hypothetical protein
MTPPPLPANPPAETSGTGQAGFVLGLLGVILGLLLNIGLGFILSVLGIIFGAVGKSKAGLTLGIIGTIIPVIALHNLINH